MSVFFYICDYFHITPADFFEILEIYNQYPVAELIVHPRVRKDFYRHPVRHEIFEQAVSSCKMPVSFNGGIVTVEDFEECAEKYPQVKAIMIGQGLVSDPFLADRIKFSAVSDAKRLRSFHDELFAVYAELFRSQNNAAQRMKELWFYLIRLFDGGDHLGKQILKSKTAQDYILSVNRVFSELPIKNKSLEFFKAFCFLIFRGFNVYFYKVFVYRWNCSSVNKRCTCCNTAF